MPSTHSAGQLCQQRQTGLASLLSHANRLMPNQKIAYVRLMLGVIAQALVTASQRDPIMQDELRGYPEGFRIRLSVLPDSGDKRLGFTLQVSDIDGIRQFIQSNDTTMPNLSLQFKHVAMAFLVFSFQESTTQAFANDRMIADGDLAYAVRFVRLLNQLEAVILPKALAMRAIKRYPKLSLSQKLRQARPIYLAVVKQMTRQLFSRQAPRRIV